VIADDHPLFRGALREAVSGLFGDANIAEAGSFDDAVALLDRGGDVDLVLLDLTMPGVRGFSGLMYLRAQYPSVPVVVVSANDDPAVIRRCMEFGASGFIPKTLGVEEMRLAIARVLEGGVWTPPDVDLKAGTDAVGRPAQQADRLQPHRLGSDREGARLGDFAKAQRREPHPGGDRGRQDRIGTVAAGVDGESEMASSE
jgi:DNA-binding NarL/FixJ family response regulator